MTTRLPQLKSAHICRRQSAYGPQTQRRMAERIHARETLELDTSRASLATRPTQVVEFITQAAAAIGCGDLPAGTQ
jgi:hypothetical protein